MLRTERNVFQLFCSYYVSLVRTVVRRFIMVPICSKGLFIRVFEVRDTIGLLKRKVGRWCRRKDWRRRKIFLGYLSVGYSRLGV
jgi:hypothetical protein